MNQYTFRSSPGGPHNFKAPSLLGVRSCRHRVRHSIILTLTFNCILLLLLFFSSSSSSSSFSSSSSSSLLRFISSSNNQSLSFIFNHYTLAHLKMARKQIYFSFTFKFSPINYLSQFFTRLQFNYN